jgi:hypothetical protein
MFAIQIIFLVRVSKDEFCLIIDNKAEDLGLDYIKILK